MAVESLIRDLVTALGLVLVLEGLMYAIAPLQMRRLIAMAVMVPVGQMRTAGAIAVAIGVIIVGLIRGG